MQAGTWSLVGDRRTLIYLALANPGRELVVFVGLTGGFSDERELPLRGSNRKRRLKHWHYTLLKRNAKRMEANLKHCIMSQKLDDKGWRNSNTCYFQNTFNKSEVGFWVD